MDQIKIENLEVFAHHGVFPEETKLGQKFLVSITLYLSTRRAGIDDDLLKSVHYGEVSQLAFKFLQENTYKLIEAAAENLAEEILTKFGLVKKVCVLIKKPWAPIGLPLENVGVEITREWNTVYLSFGSNMGNKDAFIKAGIDELSNHPKCVVEQVSKLIQTKPYGMMEQDDFLNGCLRLCTLLSPQELLELLHEIELHANRERKVHWGPRTLDMDILYYNDEIIQSEDLIIPHVDMQNRTFVLEPLCEIAPYQLHPVYQKTTQQLLEELKGK